MRFVVVPLSTKSAFIFCQQTVLPPTLLAAKAAAHHEVPTAIPARSSPRLDDRFVLRAKKFWNSWEQSPSKWKQTIVSWANKALERIPYDEYSLKSIPSKSSVLRKVQKEEEEYSHVSVAELEKIKHDVAAIQSIEVQYPSDVLTKDQSLEIMSKLASNGVNMHLKYFWISLGLSPFTLPVALLPVLPNLPGFYLLYRAWSNWKAWEGAKHLSYLIKEDHLTFVANQALNKAYVGSPRFLSTIPDKSNLESAPANEEVVILDSQRIKEVATSVEATSELSAELARAVHQVEKKIASEQKKDSTS